MIPVLPADIIPPKGSAQPFVQAKHPRNFLVTGATGFLGAFIVAQLIDRVLTLDGVQPDSTALDPLKVTCLARAKTNDAALARVITNLQHHSCWNPQYEPYLVGIAGDISRAQWGLADEDWTSLATSVDAIVHNGAVVHFLAPYHKIAPTNVDGTIWALRLAVAGNKLKPVHYVSSGTVLFSPHQFVTLLSRGEIVREDDPLDPATTVLCTSYGETKWVAEKRCAQAAALGVPVTVVRAAWISGSSKTGTVTDSSSLLFHLIKACIEIGAVPETDEKVGLVAMTPVDYVAELVAALTLMDAAQIKDMPQLRTEPAGTWARKWNLAVLSWDQWCARNVYAIRTQGRGHPLAPLRNQLLGWMQRYLLSIPDWSTMQTNMVMRAWREQLLAANVVEVPTVLATPADELMPLYLADLVVKGFLPAPKAKGTQNLRAKL
ncbi:thioester reductase domain-containing protein [Allomyces macrogynus ATCC 38327]|uniref:Thioester reductase domain-containing protein n=1 Tax=Allomyces macrogynus (strain ATCC 38327) TaxID=578462 RepID=A0A0L0T102_ALLM3|nr:thioester reductase domain-containing protein [Allomyces macrogynus ATCC 38327]|eukprot:KNE68432.1 thioester reductase domain-containing protein [Allomyces macrogynus ATCC 38327]